MKSVAFFLKCLVLSVFKPSNLTLLGYRALTVAAVLAHYVVVERIDYWQQAVRENEQAFITLVLAWHLVSVNLKVAEESRRKKNIQHTNLILAIVAMFAIPGIVVILLTPFFAWFDVSLTHLHTSYWTTRYLLTLLYILMNCVTSIFPHVFNFLFFLSDGVILSQLTSLYLFNELSMSALLTILPLHFVLHNHLLLRGIQSFTKDEARGKLSFARLIGRHDSVFMFVTYALFQAIFTIVDTLSSDWRFMVNMWYLMYALYAFAKLMDHKQS
jgi:hypothetical protein